MPIQIFQDQLIRNILQVYYQFRTLIESELIVSIFMSSDLQLCSLDKAKMLAFYAQKNAISGLQGGEQNLLQSKSLLFWHNKQKKSFSHCQLTSKIQADIACPSKDYIIIKSKDVEAGEALGWNSPEKQVKFLHQCPILSDIPKKQLYGILRNSKFRRLCSTQMFDLLNTDESEDYYFLVRSGQFCFVHRNSQTNKNVEVLSFRSGCFFGKNLTQTQNQQQFLQYSRYLTSKPIVPKFNFYAKCKSSTGVIYCIDRYYFNSNLLKFCEAELNNHLNNQNSLLKQRVKFIQRKRSSTAINFRSQPPVTAKSTQLLLLTSPSRSFSRQKPPITQKLNVINFQDKPSSYRQIRKSLPSRNRLYSKVQLKRFYPNPEQDESDALLWKKAKCQRLREITRPLSQVPTRSQILYQFTQSMVQFQKNKNKPILL